MKTRLYLLLAACCLCLCAGCSTSTIQIGDLRASNTRWFWSSTDFSAKASGTNGIVIELGLKSSNTQTDAIVAAGNIGAQITAAAVTAAKK